MNIRKIKLFTGEKDLGVIFDEQLLFRKHVVKKVALANRNLGMIFKSFTYTDREMFLNLYKSLVRLEYATPVWSPMFKKDSIILEKIQRRATRLVNSLSGLTYENRLMALGIPTLEVEYRRLRDDVIEVSKILNQIDRIDPNKSIEI